jgi:hypothetical protein
LLASVSPAQATISWSSELLTNGGFETGYATGWTNGGGGTVTIGTICPEGNGGPRTGTYQAYWTAPSNSAYYLYQTVDLFKLCERH